jgi:hypothetical protein
MPRHAAPDHDRLGALLTVSWAALNLAGLALLGLAVRDAQQGNHQAAMPPTASAMDNDAAT